MIHWDSFPSIADHSPTEIDIDTHEARQIGYQIDKATVFLCENGIKRAKSNELLDLAFRDALDIVNGADPTMVAGDLQTQWQIESDHLFLYDARVDLGLWTSGDVAHLFERYISHCHDLHLPGFVAKDKRAVIVTEGMSKSEAEQLQLYGTNAQQDRRTIRKAAASGLTQIHHRRQ